jgi:HTH-type transcriptional regulator/antitoxin HipB
MTEWELAGAVRRIRRRADMSQRQIAQACGVGPSVVAKAEAGTRDLPTGLLARLAAAAGLRLALLDSATGAEVEPMSHDAVRDAGGRLFPAHLDTRHGDDDWWGTEHRPRTRQPRYTFDIDRRLRDRRRRAATPTDHHVPTPGDSLAERAAARRQEAVRREADERQRWFLDPARARLPDSFTCWCPPECDEEEDGADELAHTGSCECRCDLA